MGILLFKTFKPKKSFGQELYFRCEHERYDFNEEVPEKREEAEHLVRRTIIKLIADLSRMVYDETKASFKIAAKK
ncbi:hypothetical protein QTN47_15215 [Danxiaibacter flavus]|uniref:Uncharacterized protein n=1 Tax=Danxiaibacter flavus TaxID=3049108 RepID=A0ABV3ZG41_9BACT|nr:hypothetical protein QNM32_15225 [Chitinophagaceae bacterium DXS]